jgi:hypothetical protein
MSTSTWRTIAILLGLVCLYQAWRGCHRPAASALRPGLSGTRTAYGGPAPSGDPTDRRADPGRPASAIPDSAEEEEAEPPRSGPPAMVTSAIAVARWLAPHPGEGMLDYRDRVVPIAQAAIAPHRARVARLRDRFAAEAGLDAHQRAELDAAVEGAADAIKDRVMQAVLGGEVLPPNLTPSAGVAVVRDLLDAVDRAHQRFDATLTDRQRAASRAAGFDIADYLLFSTRWEEMLGYVDPG